MIAVNLVGRIGNQLFIYAAAEAIRQKRGRNEKIVFYDESILNAGWKNSLLDYPLENVEYVHDMKNRSLITLFQAYIASRSYRLFKIYTPDKRYQFEKKMQPIWNHFGTISCCNGYVDIQTPKTYNVWMSGYFQSEKYFAEIIPLLRNKFLYRLPLLRNKYYVQQIENRNSICVSIKVEHNADNPLYDVCGREYYEKAIKYIQKHVENPLFFICSDNVQYVLDHYIDAQKYDCICQEKGLQVSDSLAIMATCKHFVIGNTSFGWWAQLLSSNPEKIVVGPNHWFRDEKMPVDIYGKDWHFIDVEDYIEKTRKNYE